MASTPQTPERTERPAPEAASPLDEFRPPTASTRERPGRAIAALVVGIIGVLTCLIPIVAIILGIVAIVLGATTRADIARNGLAGRGQATAGMVLGIIAVLAGIGFWVAAVAVST
jgi:Domain of unknown function (DUF4190)